MKSKIFFIFFFSLNAVLAQELKCKVKLNASQLDINTSGDKQIFIQLEQAIENFMNTQRWTNDQFEEKEKIKCNLNINLLKVKGQYAFSGNAQFQVTRPIYGTTQETVLLNYIDRSFDVSFAPEERTMLFNEQTFQNTLTSTLAFYSLIALSLDYDSFSKLGGTPYIDRAFNIATVAGNASAGPWTQDGDPRNRFFLVENLRNQQLNPFRDGYYTYHRLILDNFGANVEESRKQIIEYLNTIKQVSSLKPNAVIIRNFFDSKANELIQIFMASPKEEKQVAFKLLNSLDPTKSEQYRQILK